jgi:hypothetical protein
MGGTMSRFCLLVTAMLLLVSGAMAGDWSTRFAVAMGTDMPAGDELEKRFASDGGSYSNFYLYPVAHIALSVEAPEFVSRHVPVEAVIAYSGRYASGGGTKALSTAKRFENYLIDGPVARYSFSTTLRVFTKTEHMNGKPSIFVAGLGLTAVQFVSQMAVAHDYGHTTRTENQYDVQLRGNGFVRWQVQPIRPNGIFFELDMARALNDRNTDYLPIMSLMATMGYRFPI